jgi:hypothetical protein
MPVLLGHAGISCPQRGTMERGAMTALEFYILRAALKKDLTFQR